MSDNTNALVSLETDMGIQDFYSIDELKAWVDHENKEFSWLNGLQDKNCHPVFQLYHQWNNKINTQISAYRQQESNNNEGARKATLNHIVNEFRKGFSTDNLISSHSAEFQFIASIQEQKGGIFACYVLAFLINKKIEITADCMEPAFVAFSYKKGDKDTTHSQAKSFHKAMNGWQEKFNEQYEGLKAKEEQRDTDYEDKKVQLQNLKDNFEEQQEAQQEGFDKVVSAAKEELQDITETYDKKLSLQASVSYWEKKKKHHHDVMISFGIITVIVAFITAVIVVVTAHKLFQDSSVVDVKLWAIGIVLLISTIGIWLTRLSSKIFNAVLNFSPRGHAIACF